VAQGVKLDRPKIDSATERKVRKQLTKGIGILKVAKSLGLGTGTVQRIAKERALLMPREMQVEHSGGVKAMTDEQLERSLEILKELIAKRDAAANVNVIEGVAESVPALPPPSRKARRKVRRTDSGLAARVVGTDSADGNSQQSTSGPRTQCRCG
jgi:hypothetical protein